MKWPAPIWKKPIQKLVYGLVTAPSQNWPVSTRAFVKIFGKRLWATTQATSTMVWGSMVSSRFRPGMPTTAHAGEFPGPNKKESEYA